MLDGVNVALGVTGSIAAVRCVELIHEFRRRGASVRVVMSSAAGDIVHPWALEFASDESVVTELTGAVEHIELCGRDGWADVFTIAPATANTIGKIANAVDDTTVTTCATTAIGSDIPLVVAPAMHEPMRDHPGVQANIETLESEYGVDIVPPRIEEGKAKIADDEAIILSTARATNDRPLSGRRVAVTSGPTSEAIDPVRSLSTRASGRTGRALAKALFIRGADVVLLQSDDDDPLYATVRQAISANEMEQAALAEVDAGLDAFVSAAAISDYTVEAHEEKLPSGEERTLELTQTPKVIGSVRDAAPDLPIVGFKAASEDDDADLAERARELQHEHDLAFVVANDVSVMGAEETRVLLVDGESVSVCEGSKSAVGAAIADRVASVLS